MDQVNQLANETLLSEAYLTGIFWNNPFLYNLYSKEKINTSMFNNKAYSFFFGLGREIANKGIIIFDDISVYKVVNELGLQSHYLKYGEYETIQELMFEVKDKSENLEAYYNEIKKYNLIKNLMRLFGDKVLLNTDKYNYKRMSKEQLHIYWMDKVNQIAIDGDNRYDEQYLLKDLQQSIDEWNSNPSIGLPFFKSKYMTKICTGWDYGNLYLFGGFGGSGKTSFTFSKIIMSCIANKDKLLVIANEQTVDEFKKLLIMTALGQLNADRDKTDKIDNYINRQRLNEGNFTADEMQKLALASEWVRKLCDDDKIITFVFMENYVIEDVKKLIRYYNARGIRRVLIDTGKPSDNSTDKARWEVFTEDFKELYKLARPNGGGLDIALWANVQLSDSALTRRYLNEHALGESKKIKNEASVVFMFRSIFDDEFEGERNELTVTSYEYDKIKNEYIKIESKLQKGEQYYLLFTSKNRRGQDNKTGQKVLVLRPNFNFNLWFEVGWTTVFDDRNY